MYKFNEKITTFNLSNIFPFSNPKKEDNFAEETFNTINNDLEGLRVRTTGYSSAMRSTMGVETNAYENLTDIESTRAYKYKNNSSSAFTKK